MEMLIKKKISLENWISRKFINKYNNKLLIITLN